MKLLIWLISNFCSTLKNVLIEGSLAAVMCSVGNALTENATANSLRVKIYIVNVN